MEVEEERVRENLAEQVGAALLQARTGPAGDLEE